MSIIAFPSAAQASARLKCSSCGVEVDAGCSCGAPYVPAGERAAAAIAETPTESNRAIAERIGVDEKTIRKERKSTADQSAVEKRTGKDGRVRRLPAKKIEVVVDDVAASAKKSRKFDSEHYAFMLGQDVKQLVVLEDERPERLDRILGHLLDDTDCLEALAQLARHPKGAVIVAAVAAKLGDVAGGPADSDELSVALRQRDMENLDLKARVAELEAEIERLRAFPSDGSIPPFMRRDLIAKSETAS
jgi:hypothetical protein